MDDVTSKIIVTIIYAIPFLAVGLLAAKKGKSVWGWCFLSIFITPFIPLIILLLSKGEAVSGTLREIARKAKETAK